MSDTFQIYGYNFQVKLLSALFKDKPFLQQISDILDSNYGYLRITSFQSKTGSSLKNVLLKINKKNNFNIEHTHPNSFLSAAYYVKAPENCGSFKASNPLQIARERIAISDKKTELNTNIVNIKPTEGDLLLFPAYLPHSVGMNLSDEDRIVISFNVDIK